MATSILPAGFPSEYITEHGLFDIERATQLIAERWEQEPARRAAEALDLLLLQYNPAFGEYDWNWMVDALHEASLQATDGTAMAPLVARSIATMFHWEEVEAEREAETAVHRENEAYLDQQMRLGAFNA